MATDELLVRKRSAMKAKLTNFCNHVNVLLSCESLSSLQRIELEGRLSKFDALYNEFDSLQLEIEVLSDKPDEAYGERTKFEERYHAVAAQARSLLFADAGNDATSVVGSAGKNTGASFPRNFVRLPKIDLPQFDGSYQCWLEYRDIYISLIHNSSSIDDISKFHYLRASLKGDAQQIIKNIDFKGDHYQMAWNLLCERYDNSRLLVNNHVQALFNVPAVCKESCMDLRQFIDIINKNIRALKTLNEPTEYWDTLLLYMLTNKVDTITNRDWQEYCNSLPKVPTLSQFCLFVSKRADLLETVERSTQSIQKVENTTNSYIVVKQSSNRSDNVNNNKQKKDTKNYNKCPMCKKDHFMFVCEDFRKLTVENRLLKVKELKLCFNCLRPGHSSKQCKLTNCKYCKRRHNTLIHVDQPDSANFQDPMPSTALPSLTTEVTGGPHFQNSMPESVAFSGDTPENSTSSVLLSTALVTVVNNRGEKLDARILLDNGSTANFVSETLCHKLGLSRRNASSTITDINNQISNSTQSCRFTIQSRDGVYNETISCIVLPEITRMLPSSMVDISKISIPTDIQLADPSFHIQSVIDILVGAEVFWNVLGTSSISLGKNQPKLHATRFGWIVSGPVPIVSSSRKLTHCCNVSIDELHCSMNRFWELDSVSSIHSLSQEERACEENFLHNTIRDEQGRFVVTIPLKNNPNVLGESYERAKRRFLSLERRFLRDTSFKTRYVAFMEEYERLGHMTENRTSMKPHTGDNVEYFLPHHGVIKESSSTPLRAVFDASAATSSGISFNDIQMVGPTVQEDLFSILLRFRQHKFVISGDIARMYRAVAVTPSQRALQQIIFRTDPKLPLTKYSLNTVTYGTSSAPYLATKCLISLAKFATSKAVKSSIERDFYVDDYLSGGNSISEVVDMVKEVISVLSSANFHLRKWQSNNLSILNQITTSSEASGYLNLAEGRNVASKTLGLRWVCEGDYLSFSIHTDTKKQVTKRQILSVISQIFDPLGLVGPCVLEAKIIMQQLWLAKCDWDDHVPESVCGLWYNFINTLPSLNTLKIPRWVVCDDALLHEIHVFTDASEKAYGCCVYLRSVNEQGIVQVQLFASKNRVAPIKPTTIPRLELCGALLGARLCAKVLSSITLSITSCQFWSDSTIVLSWLAMSPSLLKPFVRNRVNEIQESTTGHTWSYVPSKDNPADLVSRGLKADLISECSLWWSGPQFLLNHKEDWPVMPNRSVKQDLPEVIASNFIDHSFLTQSKKHVHSSLTNPSVIQSLIHKYSNINRLQRIVSYIHRFIYNLRKPNSKVTGPLSIKELKNALSVLLRVVQSEMFPDEYAIMRSGKSLPRKNRLISLTPFLDKDNIVRVGGRLNNSPYEYGVKHPILLCGKHHFTKMLFEMQHRILLHAGPQLLLTNIRQMYWPLGGRNLSKSIVKRCIECFRYKTQNVQPIMGQLPSDRTHLEFPFFNCSVDYAGPILIADRKGRGCKLSKAYICIFVCLAVKAVHIELVTDLTKEGYMAALNRFVARRGKPKSILSDNGTNFVGTCNELHKFLQNSNISYEVSQKGIEFNFAPPYSPHFNGIAEAAVRSTKHHLKRLLGLTHFTYEEMITCLSRIEAVLNSRPLTPFSSDPLDFTALTPSHFLIGRSLMTVPHPQVAETSISRLELYQRVEHIKQHFWKRFHLEYVSLLQQKTKWPTSSGQLLEGTLVLVRERGQPPLLWPLGRVTKVFPGSDGTTRVVELKTKKGTLLRSFNNICPLPLD